MIWIDLTYFDTNNEIRQCQRLFFVDVGIGIRFVNIMIKYRVKIKKRGDCMPIVASTGPNAEGEMLWCIHYMSSYYDSDPRGSSNHSLDGWFYVLARSREEAILKAQFDIDKVRRLKDGGAVEQIVATIVILEDLIPARDSSEEGRFGRTSNEKLRAVQLTGADDE